MAGLPRHRSWRDLRSVRVGGAFVRGVLQLDGEAQLLPDELAGYRNELAQRLRATALPAE